MFSDNTTVVSLITNGDESAYREEVRDLAVWCQDNILSLNVSKTKELIVDYRIKRGEHTPIQINWAVVEGVESFKFLHIHITKDMTRSTHTCSIVKRARQHLFSLSRLKRLGMVPQILKTFYSCTIESILTGCVPLGMAIATPLTTKTYKGGCGQPSTSLGSYCFIYQQ